MTLLREHEITFRVRYPEVDRMGYVHHANYLVYFEMGRVELMREIGRGSHREMEDGGLLAIVAQAEIDFKRPARYDDQLRLRTTVVRTTRVKIFHEYHLFRGEELLTIGRITLAMIDTDGKIQPIPEWMQVPAMND